MRIDIVSVFPEYFNVLDLSLLGKAQDKGLVEFGIHNLRDWTHDVLSLIHISEPTRPY